MAKCASEEVRWNSIRWTDELTHSHSHCLSGLTWHFTKSWCWCSWVFFGTRLLTFRYYQRFTYRFGTHRATLYLRKVRPKNKRKIIVLLLALMLSSPTDRIKTVWGGGGEEERNHSIKRRFKGKFPVFSTPTVDQNKRYEKRYRERAKKTVKIKWRKLLAKSAGERARASWDFPRNGFCIFIFLFRCSDSLYDVDECECCCAWYRESKMFFRIN